MAGVCLEWKHSRPSRPEAARAGDDVVAAIESGMSHRGQAAGVVDQGDGVEGGDFELWHVGGGGFF